MTEACKPCKPKKAPVFNTGDIVQHIWTKEVFSIGVVSHTHNQRMYAHKLSSTQHGWCCDVLYSGNDLIKFTGKK
jgi:hypothetical protein